jgi:hypothetical protein
MEEESVQVTLKSGQSWDILLPKKPCVVPVSCSLEVLKETVSRHLGDTPSPQFIVLAIPVRGCLEQLTGEVRLVAGSELFVFSSKTWRAFEVVNDSSASFDDKKRVVAEATFGIENDLDFLERVKRMSLQNDKEGQAGRERLEKRAAMFGLRENKAIDTTGDCQFDAAADQLRKYRQFGGETKESVRKRAVEWIREHADYDLGHGTSVKQWIQAMLENNGSFDGYVVAISQEQCWGDEVTLLAITETYQVGIVLVSSTVGENNWYRAHYPRGKGERDEVPLLWLGHELERHYWSLVKGKVVKVGMPLNELERQVAIKLQEIQALLECQQDCIESTESEGNFQWEKDPNFRSLIIVLVEWYVDKINGKSRRFDMTKFVNEWIKSNRKDGVRNDFVKAYLLAAWKWLQSGTRLPEAIRMRQDEATTDQKSRYKKALEKWY